MIEVENDLIEKKNIKRKNKKNFIQNLIKNQYITNGTVWTVDETFFGETFILFLIISLKSRAIIGLILSKKRAQEDEILELYELLVQEIKGGTPHIIHSDCALEYQTNKIKQFCKEHNIQMSNSIGSAHQNQVSESVNNVIKATVIEELHKQSGFKAFENTIPENLKTLSFEEKKKNKEYRKLIFNSLLFKSKGQQAIQGAITIFNNNTNHLDVVRKDAEYVYQKIDPTNELQLVKSTDPQATVINENNLEEVRRVREAIFEIWQEPDVSEYVKLKRISDLMLSNSDNNQTHQLLRLGFGVVFKQNEELIKSNRQLVETLYKMELSFKEVSDELNIQKQDRYEKQERKMKRALRIAQTKREAITQEIYQKIQELTPNKNATYTVARMRMAFCLLVITGVRISELLPITKKQIQDLFSHGWIKIDRLKRGPSNHKAFLSKEGKSVLEAHRKDAEVLFGNKEEEHFIFSNQNTPQKPLRRETFTITINKKLHEISEQIEEKPNITSHSFRAGYITSLWKDTGDIEFVRQVIGHTTIETTKCYVENLSEEERGFRIANIKPKNDFVK